MTNKSDKDMLEENDANLIERTIRTDKLQENKKTDVLELTRLLGYKINKDMISELVIVHEFELPEYDPVTFTFYTYPEEKNSRPSGTIKRKLENMADDFALIALADSLRDRDDIKQDTKGLIKKRIQLPRYIVTIIKKTGLINCKSNKEILEYNFSDIIDMFI